MNLHSFNCLDSLAPEYEKKPVEDGGRALTRKKKIECPAQVVLYRFVKVETGAGGEAQCTKGPWYVQSLCAEHNHKIAADPRELREGPFSRHERDEFYEQWQCGITPSQLAEHVQGKKRGYVSPQDVINAIQERRRTYMRGREDVKVLEDQLRNGGLWHKVRSLSVTRYVCVDQEICMMHVRACRTLFNSS